MSDAIAKLPLRQVQSVQDLLKNDMARQQLASVAAKHMNPQRLMRLVANSVRTTPKLAECAPLSLLGSLMTCASLGLEPNTVMGHAYLIPFRNNKKGITEVQIIIGYKGLIDLARRSGHITSISANIHYSDDDLWDYEEGTQARLRHKPGNLEGDKIHAYAIAQFKDGGHAYVVLPWAQVIKVRDESQNWKTAVQYNTTSNNAWAKHEDEMAKKTAIRALMKYLPLSTEFRDAVEVDSVEIDYSNFALDPLSGLEIQGEVIESEVTANEASVQDNTPRPKEHNKNAQADAQSNDPKPQQQNDNSQFQAIVTRIKSEIEQTNDQSALDAVLELYEAEIDSLPTECMDDVQELITSKNQGF